ncbi:unnamed protein product [Ilex paraguariensis]|uniref:Uncharacterized protein n=1 Tax=Ilex paraguariensis TaxID=185542 RepID=A0ABC8V3I0_9AQUA
MAINNNELEGTSVFAESNPFNFALFHSVQEYVVLPLTTIREVRVVLSRARAYGASEEKSRAAKVACDDMFFRVWELDFLLRVD